MILNRLKGLIEEMDKRIEGFNMCIDGMTIATQWVCPPSCSVPVGPPAATDLEHMACRYSTVIKPRKTWFVLCITLPESAILDPHIVRLHCCASLQVYYPVNSPLVLFGY